MDLIPSFSVDHSRLLPGVYISRTDVLNGSKITTYDIRMKKPNIEPCVDVAAMHTLEHIIATYLRNNAQWKDSIIYWGPMGCLTGNYLLVKGDLTSQDILPLIQDTFAFISEFEGEVPGQSEKDCGNHLLMNLPEAKWEARKYLKEVLENISDKNLFYPN